MAKELKYTSDSGNVELIVSEDLFSAYLKISDNGIISENEIKDVIGKAGIKKLLDPDEINRGEIKEFDKPFLIARTITGKELSVNPLFNVTRSFNPDKIKTLSDFNKITGVKEDVPLAVIELNKIDANEQFYDVLGNPISDENIKERYARNFLGDKVYYSKSDSRIFSGKKGYPYISSEGTIGIKSDFECNDDLHKVKADFYGNLLINGNIDNCQIKVSGDLVVKGKISNCLNTWIMSQGKLEFISAENSFLGSRKNINFSKSTRYCYIVSDGKINGGEQSIVIGGLMKSAEGITVSTAGSSVPVKTRLEISTLPFLRENLKKITTRINKLKKKNNMDILSMVEIQKRLERELESSYKQLLTAEHAPTIKVKDKLHKETWIRMFGKRRGVFKESSNVEITSDRQGIKINLS